MGNDYTIKRPSYNFKKTEHDVHLENIIYHIKELGEVNVETILKETYWRIGKDTHKISKLCDLLLISFDGKGIPLELKGQKKEKGAAKKQIIEGKKYLEEKLNIPVEYGKIVIYRPEGYYFKDYFFEDSHWTNWQRRLFVK